MQDDAADVASGADSAEQTDTGAALPRYPSTAPATIGGKRPAKVVVPATYKPDQDYPAVVLLGGYDYFAKDLDDWLGLSGAVDARGFVLLMPDGLVDKEGSPYWNATETCCDFDGSGVDDVGYLLGLIDELGAKVRIDPKRIALVGHSAGGFMAYRLACEATGQFSAIASIAGAGFKDASKCKATGKLSVLQVHGDADDVMPFGGDSGAPAAIEMMQRWAKRNGCDSSSWQLSAAKLEHADDGKNAETSVLAYTKGCKTGTDVRLWKMAGNDHYPEFTVTFRDNLLSWVLSKNAPD